MAVGFQLLLYGRRAGMLCREGLADIEFYTVLRPSVYSRIGQWVPKVVLRAYVEDIWLCLRTPLADANGPDVSIEAIGQRHRAEQNVTSHHAMSKYSMPRPLFPTLIGKSKRYTSMRAL